MSEHSSDFRSVIASRRDGKANAKADLEWIADGAANGTIPDYQLSAWLMAAYFNPLGAEETSALTLAMANSGERINLTGLPKPWVDKHSTGGVGDKTTLVVLPILAACGLTMVKMSGRGLGITGGTIDKLESIPGFRVDLSPAELKSQASKIGLALAGQTAALAPADKALYSLRDVTETVSSIPLIVSSILSKKLAAGAETIVLDVKCGSGAFMHTTQEARVLAKALMEIGTACGLKTRVAITDMNQPLGAAVGNALEVHEALETLSGQPILNPATGRFRKLCVALAAHTLVAAEVADFHEAAVELVEEALSGGSAMEKARHWFQAQGAADPGSSHFVLGAAPVTENWSPKSGGWISHCNAETVGRAVVRLGGGRRTKDDSIDRRVGVVFHKCVGSKVNAGELVFTVHAADYSSAQDAVNRIGSAISMTTFEYPSVEPILAVLS